ncbi:MAG: tetratricopeptide repeat protein [Candidatus Obscuribacterales bacterium]|nr:tetratricopeptide repeat protein [Candidatus Obscuribacterales bacterium]
MDTVRKIMRDKNYNAAKPLLDAYLKKNPNSSLALVYRSHCYVDENKLKEALDCLYRAAKADPTNSEVYAEQANIYAVQRQHQKAIDAATLSIKYGKRNSVKHMYHLRSMMLSGQGKYKKAIEDMNSYLKIDSVKHRAYMWRATAYEQDGQLDKAMADYRTGMQISKNYEYRFHTARVLQKQGKMEEAVAEMTAIIKQNPEEDEAWNKRGTLYFAMGKYQESVKDFTQALATSFGSNETIYRSRGRAYEKLGQKDLAQKDFKKAEELQKKPPVAPI